MWESFEMATPSNQVRLLQCLVFLLTFLSKNTSHETLPYLKETSFWPYSPSVPL